MGRANPISLRSRVFGNNWQSNVRHSFLSSYVKHIFQDALLSPPSIRASTTGIWVSLTMFAPPTTFETHPLLNTKSGRPSLDFKHTHKFTPEIMGRYERRVANLLHGMERRGMTCTISRCSLSVLSILMFYFLSRKSPLNFMPYTIIGTRGRKGRPAWLRDSSNKILRDPSTNEPIEKYKTGVIDADFKSLSDRPERLHHYYGRLAGYSVEGGERVSNGNTPPLNLMDSLGARDDLMKALHIFR
jgi:hypothetical protein